MDSKMKKTLAVNINSYADIQVVEMLLQYTKLQIICLLNENLMKDKLFAKNIEFLKGAPSRVYFVPSFEGSLDFCRSFYNSTVCLSLQRNCLGENEIVIASLVCEDKVQITHPFVYCTKEVLLDFVDKSLLDKEIEIIYIKDLLIAVVPYIEAAMDSKFDKEISISSSEYITPSNLMNFISGKEKLIIKTLPSSNTFYSCQYIAKDALPYCLNKFFKNL